MHEKIEDLMTILKKNNYTSLSLKEILDFLHTYGCSGPETFIVLTSGLGFGEEKVESHMSNSNYWNNEDPQEIIKEIAILTGIGREIDDDTIALTLK